jgi:hypothetical protein
MKEELGKAAKAITLADAVGTGILLVLGVVALLARAIYLAWS